MAIYSNGTSIANAGTVQGSATNLTNLPAPSSANVGTATRIINEDVRYDHAKSGILLNGKSGCLHFIIVTTKLIAPRIDDTPRIFNPNIHMSAAGPGALITEYVGYAYQVKSANPNQISTPAGGIIQNAIALSFGYAISLYLTIIGT